MLKPAHHRFWFTAFIVAGIVLAVVLLGQTVWTYVFVSRDLVRREARRQAGYDVSALERAIVTGQIRDRESLSRLMSDLQRKAGARLAWVNLIGMNGTTLAGSAADQPPLFTAADMKGTLFARDEPSRVVQRNGREILVYLFTVRLPAPARRSLSDIPPTGTAEGPKAAPGTGQVLAEIGIFRDAVSAQFGGLRQASVVNVLAACALKAALIAMAVRFPAFVRGRRWTHSFSSHVVCSRILLPAVMPVLRSAEVTALCVPAFDVGGDLFDLVSLDEHRFVFLIGDASGKNVSAALLTAVVHGAFHGGELLATGGDLSRWMHRLNTLLIQRSSEHRFVTLFCATFDARTATLTYVNGGHPPPLLYRAGNSSAEPEPLETGGPLVGLLQTPHTKRGAPSSTKGTSFSCTRTV